MSKIDFFQIRTRETRNGVLEVTPDFIVGRHKDLMVQGRSFYAIWDEKDSIWSTDEYDVQRLVDEELRAFADSQSAERTCDVKYLRSFNSKAWNKFRNYVQQVSDNSHPLDSTLTFANQGVKRDDYVSKRLPYPLAAGDYSAWDELLGVLYSVEERAKIEWAIGAVVSGDAKKIQKFVVLYGPAGTGKSTVLNIVEKLFTGYTTTFEAKALGSNNNQFATESFKGNPLVAIQHDGDLSRIEDNTKLNSIVAHEKMSMNEKFKPSYDAAVNAFLFMGTNQPVKITDSKSGLIRRLIDVHPTGVKLPENHYNTLMGQIDFELGAIAAHCLAVYRDMGKNYYSKYRPLEMMLQTDVFFNYIEYYYDIFKAQNGTTIKQAYTLYKEFCADTGIEKVLPQFKFRDELRNYFDDFHDRYQLDGAMVRSYYHGFNANRFKAPADEANAFSLVLDETSSLLDEELSGMFAQYATAEEIPSKPWSKVKETLSALDTTKLHFVKVPEQHIVIDFDLKDESGGKSLERNLEAASSWPATYGELSKSGAGVHLHYIYAGDVSELSNNYSDGIEVKSFLGGASLRRRVSRCNAVPVAELNSGLPKKEKKVLSPTVIHTEKSLRKMVERNLRKEIHPGTKPSCDFIKKILDDAYANGIVYDLTDMKPKVMNFAANSSNKAMECLKVVQTIKYESEKPEIVKSAEPTDERIAFFDVEVYPNLFVICWKFQGAEQVQRMINPTPEQVGALFSLKLVGFYNRPYDNHILYGRYLGYNNEQLYSLSQKLIVDGNRNAGFGEAYNLSYADIYEFSSLKQSLKKFEIMLGLTHIEMDLPWDEPVKEEDIPRVVEYCVNDVLATEATFVDRTGDFTARQILAELSGLSINDTTQKHTARIIFGNERRPQDYFKYTDLNEMFPGYEFKLGKSTYKGEDPGEGGYVYAEPGIYENVALLDVASMHPTSLVQLNHFGNYTAAFNDLLLARLAIKSGDYASARSMLGGRLAPYLKDETGAKQLSYALKIVINIVYGLTSAKFDNPFRMRANIDNIVAKRGALFMIDLKNHVQDLGYTVVHIKTDSIKIANADSTIIKEVSDFGKQYGYDFEHEATYDKFCLVNDAVYIARESDKWKAVGTQFQQPFVFKTLFSGENVRFEDLCETKQVSKGAIYLEFPEYGRHFIGRIGQFTPVLSEGGKLLRVHEGKDYAVTGTKGRLWKESIIARDMDRELIDMDYYWKLVKDATAQIEKFGSFDEFIK